MSGSMESPTLPPTDTAKQSYLAMLKVHHFFSNPILQVTNSTAAPLPLICGLMWRNRFLCYCVPGEEWLGQGNSIFASSRLSANVIGFSRHISQRQQADCSSEGMLLQVFLEVPNHIASQSVRAARVRSKFRVALVLHA